MCGIAILINKSSTTVPQSELKLMTDAVIHRGPNGADYQSWGNVGFGHRRLAIIDLTEGGHQPVTYNNISLTFNGEIYNYIELRETLIAEGYQFNSTSDTEVLLKAWHKWGPACQERLRGMWAFAIYDRNKDEITLSRDRFGIKPLHYTHTASRFLAGSEIKQFYSIPDFKRDLYEPIAYEFLRHGKLYHNNYTFYNDVFSVPAGANLIYNLNTHTHEIFQWYELKKESLKRKRAEDSSKVFRREFEEAVKIHLRSDVSLGACLSGGLDSSAIVCMTRYLLGKNAPLHTITSCNATAKYDEREYAAMVAQASQATEHLTYPDLNKLYEEGQLAHIAYYHDGPIASGSHFSEYAVFSKAHEAGLTVMLDGQGSDEFMAGYHEFFLLRCERLLLCGRIKTLHAAVKERAQSRGYTVAELYKEIIKNGIINRISKFHQRIPKWMNEGWAKCQQNQPGASFTGNYGAKSIEDLSLLEISSTSIPYQLHSEDRNSMIFSIESRVPFLDHHLVEHMLGRHEDDFYDKGTDKMPLRSGMRDMLPAGIYNRKTKLGFASSDDLWMRENSELVRPRIAAAAIAMGKMVHAELILAKFDDFIANRCDYDGIFFRLLSLNAWINECKISIAS